MNIKERTLNFEKDTVTMFAGGQLGIEERVLLAQTEGQTKDEVIADLQERMGNASLDAEGVMFVELAKGLIDKLAANSINIAAERLLGNPLQE
jgi:hypothetical protein